MALLVIVCLIVAFILLLCVPLDLKFVWDSLQKPPGRFRLKWFFGALGRDIQKGAPKPERKEKAKKERAGGATKNLNGIRDFIEIVRIKGLFRQLARLIKDLFKQIKLKNFTGSIRVGLGDPADTGFLFAIVNSALPFLDNLANKASVQPVFEGDSIFEAHLKGMVRLQPIKFTLPFARFIFSPVGIKLVRTFISMGWKRRKK